MMRGSPSVTSLSASSASSVAASVSTSGAGAGVVLHEVREHPCSAARHQTTNQGLGMRRRAMGGRCDRDAGQRGLAPIWLGDALGQRRRLVVLAQQDQPVDEMVRGCREPARVTDATGDPFPERRQRDGAVAVTAVDRSPG